LLHVIDFQYKLFFALERHAVDIRDIKQSVQRLNAMQAGLQPVPQFVIGEPCQTLEELQELDHKIANIGERIALVC
jgi:hypothetical protein